MTNHTMTPDELKAIIREAIREELKDAGLSLGDKEDNKAAADDFRFLRSIRVKFESASARIGGAIILAIFGGFVWLVVEGGKLLWQQR